MPAGARLQSRAVFVHSARFYDALYGFKDYGKAVASLQAVLEREAPDIQRREPQRTAVITASATNSGTAKIARVGLTP